MGITMNTEYKIERWTFEKYKELKLQEIKSEIEKTYSNTDRKSIEKEFTDLKKLNEGIIPEEFIQQYLDLMSGLRWNLVNIVPLYKPVAIFNGGANVIVGIDYYWSKEY